MLCDRLCEDNDDMMSRMTILIMKKNSNNPTTYYDNATGNDNKLSVT